MTTSNRKVVPNRNNGAIRSRLLKTVEAPPIHKRVEAFNCEECNEPMVRVLGKETVTTLEGETLVFRRTSDYLLCRSCLKLFSVVELREKNRTTQVGEVPAVSYFSVLDDDGSYELESTESGNGTKATRRSTDPSLDEDELTH